MKRNDMGQDERRDIIKQLAPEVVGKTCKDFRNEMKLTLSDISKKSNITMQSFTNFENGRNLSYKTFAIYVKLGLIQWILLKQEVAK